LSRITNLLKTKLAGLMLVAICAALVAPAFAGAQTVDPTSSQYNSVLQQVSQGGSSCNDNSGSSGSASSGSGSDCTPPPPSSNAGLGGNVGPLPFTGFDVIAMAAVALAVTGLGLGLQRAVSRHPGDDPV
jgi:hypothetical protein